MPRTLDLNPARTAQLRSAFGQTVRKLRLKAGLSQEKMARELGRGNLASAAEFDRNYAASAETRA